MRKNNNRLKKKIEKKCCFVVKVNMTQNMSDTNKIIVLKANERPPPCCNPARPLPVPHSSAYCMPATL